jgi:hypothetical protein
MKIKYILFICCVFIFLSCKDKKDEKKYFYIECISNNDSLIKYFEINTAGKVSYIDQNNVMQFIPVKYLTEDISDVHYYKAISKINSGTPELNALKYQVIFNNSLINDSISYALKKYTFTKDGWKIKSDMGVIKVYDYLSDFDKNIPAVKNNVASMVVRTIAADTYGNR